MPELRIRADHTPWTPDRLQFVVRKEDAQVAFLSFDLSFNETLVLYELFVASDHRRRGIGSTLIHEAERIAASMGYTQLLVRPKPLSEDMSEEDLITWYQQRGFTPSMGEPGIFRKEVSTV